MLVLWLSVFMIWRLISFLLYSVTTNVEKVSRRAAPMVMKTLKPVKALLAGAAVSASPSSKQSKSLRLGAVHGDRGAQKDPVSSVGSGLPSSDLASVADRKLEPLRLDRKLEPLDPRSRVGELEH